MITSKTIVCAIALVALPCSVFADYFVRPEIDYVLPQDKNKGSSEATVGYGLSFGTQLGSAREHEVSLDVLYWNENKSRIQTVPAPTASFTWKHKMLPVLLSYRYYAGPTDGRVRLFLGALAGATYADESFLANTSNAAASGTVATSHWLPTIGGTAGVEIKAADHVSFQLGYRYLHMFERDFGNPPALVYHPGSYDAHVFTGAVSFKF